MQFHYGSDVFIYTDVMKYAGLPSVFSFYGYDAFSFKNNYWGYGSYMLKEVLNNARIILPMTDEMKKDILM